LAPALMLAGITVGCGGTEDKSISKVFESSPWTGEETNTYRLGRTEDGDSYGECVLGTKPNSEDGKTRLNRLCTDGQNRDDGTVLVEPDTLVPLTSRRSQFRADKNQTLSFDSTYQPPIVTFASDENGKRRETQRNLPKPDDTSPDPGYYDDESLLWLVRGIPLRDGWEGSFQDVSAGTGQTFRVDLKVEGQERVSVPVGEFQAWRVRIRTASVTQFAWVEVEAPHRLVKARIKGIQDVTYELTSSE
jgi:hypothetical protein